MVVDFDPIGVKDYADNYFDFKLLLQIFCINWLTSVKKMP